MLILRAISQDRKKKRKTWCLYTQPLHPLYRFVLQLSLSILLTAWYAILDLSLNKLLSEFGMILDPELLVVDQACCGFECKEQATHTPVVHHLP